MKINRLSPSALKIWVTCPAQFRAMYHDERGATPSGVAAELGTAIHAALEEWVTAGLNQPATSPLSSWGTLGELQDLVRKHCTELGIHDDEVIAEGVGIVDNWHARADVWDRNIIRCEEAVTVTLPTRAGDIPFMYVIDRLDRGSDGNYEVVDYKSGRWTLKPNEVRQDWQARSYAAMTWKQNPHTEGVWVTFDYLRYGLPTGVWFSAEECEQLYNEILEMAAAIIESEGTEERLNNMCQFCVRKHECDTVRRHALAGGHLIDHVGLLLERKHDVQNTMKALKAVDAEIDALLQPHLDEAHGGFLAADGFEVTLKVGKRREIVEPHRIKDLVGVTEWSRYATMTVTSLDRLIKNSDDPASLRQKVEKYIDLRPNKPTLVVERSEEG